MVAASIAQTRFLNLDDINKRSATITLIASLELSPVPSVRMKFIIRAGRNQHLLNVNMLGNDEFKRRLRAKANALKSKGPLRFAVLRDTFTSTSR